MRAGLPLDWKGMPAMSEDECCDSPHWPHSAVGTKCKFASHLPFVGQVVSHVRPAASMFRHPFRVEESRTC